MSRTQLVNIIQELTSIHFHLDKRGDFTRGYDIPIPEWLGFNHNLIFVTL